MRTKQRCQILILWVEGCGSLFLLGWTSGAGAVRAQDLADGDLDPVTLIVHPFPCLNRYLLDDVLVQ